MFRSSIIFYILLPAILVGQNDSVEIKGTVFSDKSDVFVKNAEITFMYNDGRAKSCLSDSTGQYSIKLKKSNITGELRLTVNKKTKSTVKDGKNYLALNDVRKIDFLNNGIIIADFFLSPVIICRGPTPILFKFNSWQPIEKVEYFNKDSMTYDEAIEEIKQTLIDNPNIVIEIDANCDVREKKGRRLSKKRALFVKNELIKKKIPKKRIKVKGYGSSKLLIEDNIINKAESQEEKEALHRLNRRAGFRIVEWDYKE